MATPIDVLKIDDGTRIMRWFFRYYPSLPKREFYKWARSGQIRLNGARVRGPEILVAGDKIRIPPNAQNYKTAPEIKRGGGDEFSLADLEDLRTTIIHNDDAIVVFNKPAGLAVQGGSGIKMSVDKMAAALFPYDKISLVHRLDRETSGILIVAKNQIAAQKLTADFADKLVHKKYLALLSGVISPAHGTIDNFMVRGRILKQDEIASDKTEQKRAITNYEVARTIGEFLSFVLFSPKTGRTHQLRLHSAFSLCAPIVGDSLYGLDSQILDDGLDKIISKNNLYLFAYRISFRHPGSGKILTLRAMPPKFFKTIMDLCEFEIPE